MTFMSHHDIRISASEESKNLMKNKNATIKIAVVRMMENIINVKFWMASVKARLV